MEQRVKRQIEDGFEKMAQATIKECSKHDCRLQLMMIAGLDKFQKSIINSKILSDVGANEGEDFITFVNEIRKKVEFKYMSKI